MFKVILSIFFLFCLLINPVKASAQVNSFVTVVNPVRGEDFREEKQPPEFVVKNQIDILKKTNIKATWLLRFDVFKNPGLLGIIKNTSDEKGLFLEITPSLTSEAGVKYNQTVSWHSAGSVFLTGYSQDDRKKIVDTSFEKFKKEFGFYPKSVGAWWIDSYSLEYMEDKYGIVSALIVADQFSTDDYQIWGQHWGLPYYPAKKNALIPAQSSDSKIPVVMVQWAARDPVNGYGKGVEESTYSVQANDYIDYHNLGTDYFAKLVDIYTKQNLNQVGHLVVGLENSYSWEKYGQEYENQINLLKQKARNGQFRLVTMSEFGSWYKQTFPNLTPTQVIVSDDPLGTSQKSVWFMNNYYRVGWFSNNEGSVVRDLRQYIDGSEEICLKNACNNLNFATFATRVLDDVTYHQKWLLDQGQISDFRVLRSESNATVSYKNAADLDRKLEFLPRDISWEGKTSTIDGLILDITAKQPINQSGDKGNFVSKINFDFLVIFGQFGKILIFFYLFLFIPGVYLLNKFGQQLELSVEHLFLSSVFGLVSFIGITLLLNLFNLYWLIYVYGIVFLILYIKDKLYKIKLAFDFKTNYFIFILIIVGVIFQFLPVYKSGLNFGYGMGLWGPNTHDGMWHLSLINQLIRGVPPENPIFGGETLKNYHYFYDLIIAQTYKLTMIPIIDLVFRIYPVIFSLLLGLGLWALSKKLFNSSLASATCLYFVYFGGSFGFIISILKREEWGGESAFWANQAVSFNLNPPFAISLVIVIAVFLLLSEWLKNPSWLKTSFLAILTGSLISFKAYAAILLGLTYLVLLLAYLKTHFLYSLGLLFGTVMVATLTLILQFNVSQLVGESASLFIFSPFWFIHSMIDNPDRVGWIKLSAARDAYLQRGEGFKYILVETISLLIFIFGNLGLRFIGIFGLFVKSVAQKRLNFLIGVFCFFSLLIPILFIQKGTPWNTIQFLYYGMFFMSLFTGFVLSIWYKKLPTLLGIIFLITIFVLTPVSSLTTAKGYLYPYPHAFISTEELNGLDFLSKQKTGQVLTYPYSKNFKDGLSQPLPLYAYDSTSYVSALSKQSTFIEDEPQNDILQTDYIKRLAISKEIFNQKLGFAKENLNKNNIKYIYLLKAFNKTLNEEMLNIKKIYENKEVVIYEVI